MTLFIIIVLMLALNWWTVQRERRIQRLAASIALLEVADAVQRGDAEVIHDGMTKRLAVTAQGQTAIRQALEDLAKNPK